MKLCARCRQPILTRHKDCWYCKDKSLCHGCGKIVAGVQAVEACIEFHHQA